MKPKLLVLLGICIAAAWMLLSCAPANPVVPVTGADVSMIRSASVLNVHSNALMFFTLKHNLAGLSNLDWESAIATRPDQVDATHYIFTNKAETISELQAQYAIHPNHAGYAKAQLTAIVHVPNEMTTAYQVTIIDAESHIVWSGTLMPTGTFLE